ncbi:DUF389 domain-containing protein [Erythrobacter sp.]|uniref:DUF389 domain-containing protein n=1 Tax=Erythrobacter sp. TaxID=1042 RepID=UPI002ECE1C5B|nr:DUF389 domain-containing protein [Erythrobacter sp.]
MNEETPPPRAPSSSGYTPQASTGATITPRGGMSVTRVLFSLRRWWREDVVGTVDQAEVIERRREDCLMSERYLFMTAMSGGIAVLGLLLSSPAVVIGAMLLSPLMGPIMGLGFALSIGDYNWLKQSAISLAWGTIIAVGLTGALVFMSPIQTITPEIAARTQPNLFDLFVALFSAMAGAYAMIRGREGTIVGVAIATALMPPLATVGFGLATWNWTVFSGSLLLYVTNLITIALTAWGMARLYGFQTNLSARNTAFQNIAIVAVSIALAVPLALSLIRIAEETNAQRITRNEILESFPARALLDDLQITYGEDTISVDATVLTPRLDSEAEADVERTLSQQLQRPVELTLTQYQVGTSASAAEQAQLSARRASEEAAALERAENLATRLALVAGVEEGDVTVDRTRRRATVRAQRLDGATLAAYRALELRIAETEPDWTVELLPPIGELPGEIGWDEEGPTPEGAQALSVIEWAARRIDLPIVLTGPPAQASQAAELLARRGVSVTVREGPGPLSADWGGQ